MSRVTRWKRRGVVVALLVALYAVIWVWALWDWTVSDVKCFRPEGWQGPEMETLLATSSGDGGLFICQVAKESPEAGITERSDERKGGPDECYRYSPSDESLASSAEVWDGSFGEVTHVYWDDVYPEAMRQDRRQGLRREESVERMAGGPMRGSFLTRIVRSPSRDLAGVITADHDGRVSPPFTGNWKLSGCRMSQHYIQVLWLTGEQWMGEARRIPMTSWDSRPGHRWCKPIGLGWSADQRYIVCADEESFCVIDLSENHDGS